MGTVPIGLSQLPRAWVSISIPGYRENDGYATYSASDYEKLPLIERDLDDGLLWLLTELPVTGSLAECRQGDPEPRRLATREQLDVLLGDSQLSPPRSFRTFIGSPEPRMRVRSCTACYLDLADFAVPVSSGGWLIHFLSDQQWVLHWLMYVGDDGGEAVVVTDVPLGFISDEGSPRSFVHEFDPAAIEAAVCAESFSEFIYRFWIENEVWFALPARTFVRR